MPPPSIPPRRWLTGSLWPTRIALAGIIVLQCATVVWLEDSPRIRAPAWTFTASLVLAISGITVVGSWAFRPGRTTIWLAGSMSACLVTMRHMLVGFHAPVPPDGELLAMFGVAMLLLTGSVVDR